MHFIHIIITLYFQDIKSILLYTEYIWHLKVLAVGFGRNIKSVLVAEWENNLGV